MFHRLGSRLCVFACSMLIFSQPPVANGEGDFHVRPAELSTTSSFQKLEQTVRKLELLSELETLTRELKNLVDFEFDIETKPRDLQQLTDGESELNVVDSNNVADVTVKGYDGVDKLKRAGMEHERIKRYVKGRSKLKGKDYRESSRFKASKNNLDARSLLFQHNNGAIQLSADQVANAATNIGRFKVARRGFSTPRRNKVRGGVDQNPVDVQQQQEEEAQ